MASTYPLEVVEAARWVKANPNVKDKALEDAMEKQNWDASVKSLTAFPQVLAMMNEKLDMTQKLGRRVPGAAEGGAGRDPGAALEGAGGGQPQVRQGADGHHGAGRRHDRHQDRAGQSADGLRADLSADGVWAVAVSGLSAVLLLPAVLRPGRGVCSRSAWGSPWAAALWGNCNWGGGNVNVNVNKYNNFNRTNIQNSNWQHNSEHRKGVEYRDSASQQKFGGGQRAGAASREQFRGRAEQGRQDISRGDADRFKGGGDRGGVG